MFLDIGCFSCNWEDKGKYEWMCTCGCVWNVFETDCICPLCNRKWTYIQCPVCAYPRHHLSYQKTNLVSLSYIRNCGEKIYLRVKTFGSVTEYLMIENAWEWVNYYEGKKYFIKPAAVIIAEKRGLIKNEIFTIINNCMKQILTSKGIGLNNPLYCNSDYHFDLLINILQLKLMKSCSNYCCSTEGIEINEYYVASAKHKEWFNLFRSFSMNPNKRTY